MRERRKRQPRSICRCVLEATTPLALGSGQKDILTDRLVATDVNGLPYLPATSIAGVLRHAMKEADDLFGYVKGDEGLGSKVIFTDGILLDENGKALDGLHPEVIDGPKNNFLKRYLTLPIRQHVRIEDKGVTNNTGKFDEQVVYKGSRFVFEMEILEENDADKEAFEKLIAILCQPNLRLGGGTHNGLGLMRVVKCEKKRYSTTADWKEYANRSTSLAEEWQGENTIIEETQPEDLITYKLSLQPDDFFLFGSGFGDANADMTPVKELVVTGWKEGKAKFAEEKVLIPGSSVKGAISHRTAYWHNKLCGHYVENGEATAGDANAAVRAIFGGSQQMIERGKVYFGDCFVNSTEDKTLNHVSIDRFTGGALESALFTESVTYAKEQVTMTVNVEKSAFEGEENIRKAFEHALQDVCNGMLPLGGGVNRGLGAFKGTMEIING